MTRFFLVLGAGLLLVWEGEVMAFPFLPPWSLFDNAVPFVHGCKECFRLTEDAAWQKGCIWDDSPVDFSGPIDIQATLNFGDKDGGGADGICLVFAPSPGCGDMGVGIGAHGIPGAVVIEFDTWNNGGGWGDLPNDHVAVNINGNLQAPVLGPVDLGNIEDGQDHTIRFIWDGAGNIQVLFDGALVLAGNYDLLAALGGSSVYMGYTASTGSASNTQIVCPENIIVPPPPIPQFQVFDASVCEGATGVLYGVVPVPNVSYQWTVPPGVTINGTGETVALDWGSEGGEVCVSLDNGCEVGDTACITVEVTPLPDVTPELLPPQCAESFDLSLIVLSNQLPGQIISWHPDQMAAQLGTPDLGSPPVVYASGTYWLRVVAGDGCYQVVPVDVVLEFPELLVEQPDPVCSPGGIELSAVVLTELNGLPLAEFDFYLTQADAEAGMNGLAQTWVTASGTYWVRALTANGCPAIASIEVMILPSPEMAIEDPPTQCEGDILDLGTIFIEEVNGLDPSQYILSFHADQPSAEAGNAPLDPPHVGNSGTWWVRMTTANGCHDVAPVLVIFQPAPTADLMAVSEACQGDSTLIQFHFSGTPTFMWSWSYGTDTFTFQTNDWLEEQWVVPDSSAILAIVQFVDASSAGCDPLIGPPVSLTVHERVSVDIPVIECDQGTYRVRIRLLEGDSLSWQVTGSPGILTGSWFLSDPIANGQPYSLTIWDANGCDTLHLSAAPDCSCTTDAGTFVEAGAELCTSDTLYLTFAQNGVLDSNDLRRFVLYSGTAFGIQEVLQWSANPSFAFDPAVMQPGQTYFAAPVAGDSLGGLVDTNDLCFSLVLGIPVVFHAPPVITLPEDDTVCVAPSYLLPVALQGMAPFTLTYQIGALPPVTQSVNGTQWSLPLPAVSSNQVVFLGVSDAHCYTTLSDTFNLIVNTGPIATNFVFDCNGSNTEYTIQFSIMGGDPGSYVVTGGPGSLNGAIFTSAPISVGTMYHFVVTDAMNCKPFTVTGNYACLCLTNAGAITGGPFHVCVGDSLAFGQTGGFLDPNDTLVWWLVANPADPAGSRISSYESQFIFYPGLPVQTGKTYYLVGVAGNSGLDHGVDLSDQCLDYSVFVEVVFAEVPDIDEVVAFPLSFTCRDTTITLSVNIDTTPGILYWWSSPDGHFLSAPDEPSAVIDRPGHYTVFVTEALAGCRDSLSLEVTGDFTPPEIVTGLPDTLTCVKTAVTLTAAATGFGPGWLADWSTLSGRILQGASTLNPVVDLPGLYVLTVTHGDNGCMATSTVFVERDTMAPVSVAGPDVTVGCGQPFPDLDASSSMMSGAAAFFWSTTGGHIEDDPTLPVIRISSPGLYVLHLMDKTNGCQDLDSIWVVAGPGLQVGAVEVAGPLCHGENSGSIALPSISGGTPPFSAEIAGQMVVLPGLLTGLGAGDFHLTITDIQGCLWDTMIHIPEPPPVLVDLGPDISITWGESVFLTPSIQGGSGVYEPGDWMSAGELLCGGCSTLSWQPLEDIGVLFEAMDDRGCIGSDEVRIHVWVPRFLYVPSAFSPNADGINDIFGIYGGTSVDRVRNLAIFDRWGNSLLSLDNLPADGTAGWDGTYRGLLMDPGVYVWVAEVVFTCMTNLLV